MLKIKTILFSLLLLLFIISCKGQIKRPEIIKIHKDSITLRAELLPEYRNSIHDKEYQGNQISGVIRTVFQDKKGDFWFGTQNGLCLYNKYGLVYFELKDANGQNITVHAIIEDKIGNIWIGYGGGIAKYDGKYFTVYYQKEILINNGLWSMMMDKKGKLWIGTTQGVFTFNGEVFEHFEIPEGKIDDTRGISTTKIIHSIIEDQNGKIWFATNGGVYIYDGNSLKNISEQDGLQSYFASQIIESTDGNFWISTTTGIFRYNEKTLTNITEKLINKDGSIGCIYEDKNGILWFSVNKRDIYSYNGKEFTKIKNKENDFTPFPFQIYQDQKDRMWFVGFKGAYRYENDTFINVTRTGPW